MYHYLKTERIMKKIFFAAALCMLTAISAMAQDKLFINDFNVNAGEEVAVKVNLTNPQNIFSAVQFDLFLPEGLEVAVNAKGKMKITLNNDEETGRLDDQTCSASKASNGAYRFVISSMTSAQIYETEGEILTVTLKAADSFQSGNGSLDAIILVKPNGEKITTEATTFTVNGGTGINSVNADNSKTAVYNVAGQRVAQGYKGIVVKNGTKVVMK
jgi:hypothetical protein